jgi:uncharacterized protein
LSTHGNNHPIKGAFFAIELKHQCYFYANFVEYFFVGFETMINVLAAAAIGITAGVCSGLFGIGGGVIIVPLLVFLLGFAQKSATGTSLIALLLPVGILGVREYYRAGAINSANIKIGLMISVGMFFGALIGAKISLSLDAKTLSRAFAIFLVLVAARLWMKAA